jgi:hypothetical protein
MTVAETSHWSDVYIVVIACLFFDVVLSLVLVQMAATRIQLAYACFDRCKQMMWHAPDNHESEFKKLDIFLRQRFWGWNMTPQVHIVILGGFVTGIIKMGLAHMQTPSAEPSEFPVVMSSSQLVSLAVGPASLAYTFFVTLYLAWVTPRTFLRRGRVKNLRATETTDEQASTGHT